MTRGRHSLPARNARAQRVTLIAAPLLTCVVVGAGIAMAGPASHVVHLPVAAAADIAGGTIRTAAVSRSAERVPVRRPAARHVVRHVAKRVAARSTNPADLPIIDKPCPGTSGVENGLKPGAIRVYRAVCNDFPQITTYGGWSPYGEHASGKAIDIMTSDVALGDRIAEFLQAHAAALNLYDIIWRQHIWTPVRASEGWRLMPNRGSETANHENHVHVSTN